MIAQGARAYSGTIISYKETSDSLKVLMKKAAGYFQKYGFVKWVNLLRDRMLAIKAKPTILGEEAFGRYAFCTLVVTTVNYGNENHQDMNDDCQAITIWHEHSPTKRDETDHKVRIHNWYFLFPDMEIEVNDKWEKGVAIPLQHGTIITWDAKLVRHCTACPDVDKGTERKPNHAYGTYFGIQNQVATRCMEEAEKENKKRKKS
jgi:hypothetical protein